jgi:hypothetical protein
MGDLLSGRFRQLACQRLRPVETIPSTIFELQLQPSAALSPGAI